jgi:hypothetical protein
MAFPNQRKTETCVLNGVEYKTHYWYMDCAKDLSGMERHRIYYGQFCTDRVKSLVRSGFTAREWLLMEHALKNGDEHLNGCTKLAQWDYLDAKQLVGRLVTDCTYEDAPRGVMYWSPSQNTCILKEAARQLIEAGEHVKPKR